VKAFAAAVLVLLVMAPTAPAAAAKKPTPVQKIARGLVTAHAPGAIVFVRTPKGVHSAVAGVAQMQPRVPMRVGDRFRIASVTKTFVATVVLQLASEGKLGLDDSIEHWLPGVVPNGAPITLRHLLNHTSGLFNYVDDTAWQTTEIANPGRAWLPTELLPYSFSHGLLFTPGTNYAYSNTGYVLLGLVIEKVTGEPLGQVLRERIIDRLGLHATTFPTDAAVPEPFVHGYASIAGSPLLDITSLLHPSFLYAAGQIISSAADLTTFFGALLKGRLLPASFLTQMKTGSSASGAYGLGMGLSFSPCGRVFGHEGDFVGWRTEVWSNAKGTRIAVALVNIDTTHVSWEALENASFRALCTG
jgi:D-alanyl-D-alanine carboxypeptidase